MTRINLGQFLLLRVLVFIAFCVVPGFSQDRSDHRNDIDDLPFEVEMRRLDSVARDLRADSMKIVYLVAFNKVGTKAKNAWTRLRKSRYYLARKHNIPYRRINLVYGGTKTGLVMQIAVTQEGNKLAPNPE